MCGATMNRNARTTDLDSAELTETRDRDHASPLFVARPGAYILIVLTVVFSACAYSLRAYGIFNCQASGYGADRYLAYCGARTYGDYDYGAFWFPLEPEA